MRSFTLLGFALSAVVAVMAQDKVEPLRAVSESSSNFASNLYKSIAQNKKENFVMSPLSAYVVLSMAAYGADGNTAKQMRQSLHLPEDDLYSQKGFTNLMDHLNKVENVTLEMANTMYLSNKLNLKPQYKELANSAFKSDASVLDFAKSQESAQVVNGWVVEKTHEKIKSIVQESDLTEDTRMLLLNAIYFKGNWAKEFKKKDTTDRPFYVDEKTQKNVPTMFLKSKFIYGELPDLHAKFIELPYQNKDLKMVIIVPDQINGLAEIENNIDKFDHATLASHGYEREVFLYLPKFKIETTLPLEEDLMKLGMTDMFTSKANFTGISNENLAVSKVLQKAMIEVNEEGSEAAAVTVIQAVPYSLRQDLGEKLILRVDRPFNFQILDVNSNLSLFRGNVFTLDEE